MMASRQPVSAALEVHPLDPQDIAAWDRFVLDHAQGSPFHLNAWKNTIQEAFGYRPFYLMATDAGGVRGVLPLFLVHNRVIGKALLSSPFAVYGGILADSDAARRELYARAQRLGEELEVDYIDLRNAYAEQCVGTSNVARYVTFTQQLDPDEESLLASLPKKTRNIVRKALKQPFEMRYGCGLEHFERLYARSMRRLGTPSFPRRYFEILLQNFGKMIDIRETWLNGTPMAASLNFLFRDQMHIYYAAADARFNALGPNTYMYFDHLRWAGANGYRTFDFGRSKRDTGVFEFKRHWNTTMRELPYEILLIKGSQLPNNSPANPKFHLAIQIWKRLPLAVTRALGPRLIRLFP